MDSNSIPSSHHPDAGLSIQALTTENECLKQRVRQLEEERNRDRQTLATLQAERDGYYHSLSALLREHYARTDAGTDEDLDRLATEALQIGEFDAELKQLLQER